MNIPIRGLNHITFSVADLDTSLAFYQRVFDAKLLLRGERMAYLDFSGLWLALNVQEGLPRQETRQSYTHLAFTIDAQDLAPMKQRLNRLGVEIKPGRDRDEGEGQSLYFTDPDGHLLEFHTGNLAARLEAYREAGEEMTFYDHIFNGHGNSITGTLGTMNEEKAHIMITVANRLYVKPEHAEAFEKVFRERAGLVDGMPGFISNQVLRPVNEGEPYIVLTFWASRDDFMGWIRSDAFVKGHAQSGSLPKDAYSQPNVLELHEVIQDSIRPDMTPEPHGGPFKMH